MVNFPFIFKVETSERVDYPRIIQKSNYDITKTMLPIS